MLEDRHYMRSTGYRPHMPASVLLMTVVTVAFALQQINAVYFGYDIHRYLALSPDGLKAGYVWQLLTFQFLHVDLWHLVGNLIGIWFFGRYVEDALGKANFLKLYFFSGVVGGFLQAGLALIFPDHFGRYPVLGASAGVFGLIAAFAMLEPNGQILLFFILPIRAKYLLIVSAGIALFYTAVPSNPQYAHAAHLGGILVGVAYIHWRLYARSPRLPWHPFQSRQRKRELVKAASVKVGRWPRPRKDAEDLAPADFISREVDPILDKISAQGIQSLTERERKILEAARKKMSKR